MTENFVYMDFKRIIRKLYRELDHKNLDRDTKMTFILKSLRYHIENLESEQKWLKKKGITDVFALFSESTSIPNKDEIEQMINDAEALYT